MMRVQDLFPSQASGEHRLVVAIIGMAIEDASRVISMQELAEGKNLEKHAVEALDWLLESPSYFEAYCTLIGVNPNQVRRGLETTDFDGFYFDRKMATTRALRQRILWWRNEQFLLED